MRRTEPLEVPPPLRRNTGNIRALGVEHTGQQLMELAARECGFASLAGVDVLDVGCGVRFTQTLVNRRLEIGSYTGLEVHAGIVDFLRREVEARDERFRFVHWDARNALYNPAGAEVLAELEELPVAGDFDLIWGFSLFTHLDPVDAAAMLRLMRRHARPAGRLFFSAFADPAQEGFEDRRERPLEVAAYGLAELEEKIRAAGWVQEKFVKRDYSRPIQEREDKLPIVDYFVCRAGD